MRFDKTYFPIKNKKVLYALSGIALFLLTSFGSQAIVNKFVLAQSADGHSHGSADNGVLASVESVLGASTSNDSLGLDNGSWDGEIVSNVDIPIYPAGEGVLVNWNVTIGQQVYAGQVLGQLSPPTRSIEQNATIAERKGALESARLKGTSTTTFVDQARKKLQERRDAAGRLKDAAYKAADKQGDETLRNKEKAEADAEYIATITEIDIENAKLTKELDDANADIKGAEAANNASGLDRNIYALKSGIISGIHKNVGTYVTPDTLVASIGILNPTVNDRYIRFYIPGNYSLPSVGDELEVTRPGFPYIKYTAKIRGVGTALDEKGSYTAEAIFDKVVNLPVHSKVRVLGKNQTQGMFISLSAIWFDENGKSNVWLVNTLGIVNPQIVETGRTIGDKIEIVKGLSRDQQYVTQVTSDIKKGVKVSQTKSPEEGKEVKQTSSDGHDHEH